MRLKRLFKRTEPADPFAAFAQTYGIRIPHDTPPPKAEPVEPQPVEPQPVEPQPHDSPPPKAEPVEPQPYDASPPKAEPAEPQPHDASPPKAEPAESQSVKPGPMRAHQVLGVPLGALGHEVSQAHRKLALMHHPDKMASMGPEAEEYSEERMKEINAAYDELRRRGA
jgi:outer membrane biosynthesis protein TonB